MLGRRTCFFPLRQRSRTETIAIESKLDTLTKREQQVLALIGQGRSIPEIAGKLFRSQKTIETHRQSLGRKLGVNNRVDLARIAIRAGLAPLDQNDPDAALGDLTPDAPAHAAAQRVVLRCSEAVGGGYFRELLGTATRLAGVAGAAILAHDPDQRRFRTVAGYRRGAWLQTIEIPERDAPCNRTMQRGFLRIDSDLASSFPRLEHSLDCEMHGYMAGRLSDARGTPIGTFMLFLDEPGDFGPEAEPIIKRCSIRAGAELSRVRLIETLQRENQDLRDQLGRD